MLIVNESYTWRMRKGGGHNRKPTTGLWRDRTDVTGEEWEGDGGVRLVFAGWINGSGVNGARVKPRNRVKRGKLLQQKG